MGIFYSAGNSSCGGNGQTSGGDTTSGSSANDCQQQICSCLDSGIQSITQALTDLVNKLEDNVNKGCDDACMQDILDKIDAKYKSVTWSCDQCKDALNHGMAGTIEYAVHCAGACIEETTKTCSLGDPSSEGATCSGCGQDPCCCKDGECQPCENQQPKQWVGYCNQTDFTYQILQGSATAPGPPYVEVASGDDVNAVTSQTQQACSQSSSGIFIPLQPPEPQPVVLGGAQTCDISLFSTFEGLGQVVGTGKQEILAGGIAEILSGVGAIGIGEINAKNAAAFIEGLVSQVTKLPSLLQQWAVPTVTSAIGCNSNAGVQALYVLSSMDLIEKVAGFDARLVRVPYEYAFNASCRPMFSSPGEAISAYMANAMSYSDLDTVFAIHGFCPQATAWAVEAEQERLDKDEAIEAFHRGFINDADLSTTLRQAGYTNTVYVDLLKKLSYFSPDINTAIRAGSLGINDDGASQKAGLDEGYSDAVSGVVKQWLESKGVTDDTAKSLWRMHWQTPGVGHLTELWHRLRNDNAINANGSLTELIGNALKQLGYTEQWRKLIFDTMLVPLMRRDIQFAYTSGTIDDDLARTLLERNGYEDQSIEILTRTEQIRRRESLHTHIAVKNWIELQINGAACIAWLTGLGIPEEAARQAMVDVEYQFDNCVWVRAFSKGGLGTAWLTGKLSDHGISEQGVTAIVSKAAYLVNDTQPVNDYISGVIDQANMVSELTDDGLANDAIEAIKTRASAKKRSADAAGCARGIRERYLHGELDGQAVQNALISAGYSLASANDIFSTWQCSKSAIGRSVAIEKLCTWLGLGVITQADFVHRLVTIGYTNENAQLLLEDCIRANDMKADKEAEKRLKQMQADANKANAAAAKAQALANRQAKQLEQARAKQAQIRSNRDKQRFAASEKLYTVTQEGLAAAIEAVNTNVSTLQTQLGLGIDEALRLVMVASENYPKGSVSGFGEWVMDAAKGAAQPEDIPVIALSGDEPITTG